MSRIFGIDLGTTKTAISYVKDGEPVVIEDKSGNSVIPSMVTILENDEILVGEKSKNISIHKPKRTISGIKRHMGEDYDVDINEQKFSPPEISSYILKEICKRAEKRLDEDVSDVVITVPAYFNDRQRRATKDAAEIAGLNVKRIINEPTAVALAYGISKDGKSSNIMVYDLGGGTFDVSILEYSSDVYEVQAVDGINSVGGNDWTERIIEDINREFKRTNGYNPNDATSKRIIAEKAERVKKELSDKKETEVYIPFSSDENAELIEYRITRQEFQDMTDDLIDRTKETMIKVLGEWGKGWSNIDEILLSGSATRMNQVKEAVSSVSGINPTDELNLQEVVAKGASVQAGLLDDTVGDENLDDAILFDVTSQPLGVKIKGGLFEPIIEKNTVVPEYSSKEFTTYKNNQTAVNIEIYQGENEMAEDNVFLAEFRLTNMKEMKAGEPQVIVDFSVDSNGILTVSAEEVSSGTSKTLRVERDIGMSDKEIGDAKQLLENREHTTEKDSKTELRRRGRLLLNESKMVLEKSDIKYSKYSSLESKVNDTENLLDQEDVKTEKLKRNINSLEMMLLDLPHYNNY